MHVWPKCQSCPSAGCMPDWLLTRECLPDHLSCPVTTHGRCLGVWICVCAQKHTPSLVWPSNEGGELWRESRTSGYWLASGYTYRPICFFALRLAWWEASLWGRGGGRSPFPPGTGRDRKDTTGWGRTGRDVTWRDRRGREKHKFVQAGEGQIGQIRTGQDKKCCLCPDWLRGTDQSLQLFFCQSQLQQRSGKTAWNEMKGNVRIKWIVLFFLLPQRLAADTRKMIRANKLVYIQPVMVQLLQASFLMMNGCFCLVFVTLTWRSKSPSCTLQLWCNRPRIRLDPTTGGMQATRYSNSSETVQSTVCVCKLFHCFEKMFSWAQTVTFYQAA